MTDSDKIKYLIDLLDDTANGFANNIGLEQATGVYNILRGRYNISKSFAERVVAVYSNVNIKWLLGSDQNPFTWGDIPQKNAELGTVSEPKTEYKGKCKDCDYKDREIALLRSQIECLINEKENLQEWIGELRADKRLLETTLSDLRVLAGLGENAKSG